MTKCDKCKTAGHFKLRCVGNGTWVCMDCLSAVSVFKSDGVYVKDTMYIDGYGNESSARIRELESRVILPNVDKEYPESYFVGRREKGGRVSEREPNIYRD